MAQHRIVSFPHKGGGCLCWTALWTTATGRHSQPYFLARRRVHSNPKAFVPTLPPPPFYKRCYVVPHPKSQNCRVSETDIFEQRPNLTHRILGDATNRFILCEFQDLSTSILSPLCKCLAFVRLRRYPRVLVFVHSHQPLLASSASPAKSFIPSFLAP